MGDVLQARRGALQPHTLTCAKGNCQSGSPFVRVSRRLSPSLVPEQGVEAREQWA